MEGCAANAKSAVHALDIRSRKVISECMTSLMNGEVGRNDININNNDDDDAAEHDQITLNNVVKTETKTRRKTRGEVSKEVNAARKAMLDAVREAGKKAAAAAAAATTTTTTTTTAGRGGGGDGDGYGEDAFCGLDDAAMEFDAVLMEREAAFIALCRRVSVAGGGDGD